MKLMPEHSDPGFAQTLSATFTPEQHLAAAATGLTDEPFSPDLPASSADVKAYLDRTADLWRGLDDAVPTSLPDRVHRLWLLLLRTKLEQMQSSTGRPPRP